MTITVLLLALALLFALFLIRSAPWGHPAENSDELQHHLQPVSVPAFMNLIDSRNLDFLRRSLSAADYRRALRERNRILRTYVHRIAYNSKVLIAIAETAQRADDPAVAENGRVLLHAALVTRTRALRALASLYIGEILPGVAPDLAAAIHGYQSAAERMDSLKSLRASH
jgi:hypothetical protein